MNYEDLIKQAECHLNAHEDLQAIEDCNKAIELDPKDAVAYSIRGCAYKNKGNFDRAIEDYDKAIDLDPKYDVARDNRVNAYHAKDEKLLMRLVDIRHNQKYMDVLKGNIENVVPFLGTGVSKPYGYYTWGELLQKLLDVCCDHHDVDSTRKNQIEQSLKNNCYMDAANEMDKILPNIGAVVSVLVGRTAEANPIEVVKKCSILSEYLHLFPNKTYLTTNYDTVIENILEIQGEKVETFYPTSALKSHKKQTLNSPEKQTLKNPGLEKDIHLPEDTHGISKIYYLHGVYEIPTSITLSGLQYDDYYGADGDIRSNLRRFLPSELHSKYYNSIFLYIGCGMTVKQDRILKVLREFYGSLQNAPFSYALLNVNDIAQPEVPFENWKTLSEKMQKEANTLLNEKEDELAYMNVRVIWYSAPRNSNDGHESAKRQLLKYILEETRDSVNAKKRSDVIKARQEAAAEKQKREKLQAEFESMPHGEDTYDSEISAPKKDVNEIIWSEDQLKQVEEILQSRIRMVEASPTKCEIEFPMYKIRGELYKIYLVSENGEFYLSDEGTTYSELDRIFELKEPDVIKNLDAILKQYECRKQLPTNAYIINCTLQDIHIKMSYLIQAISFMLNMKIFYV